MLRKFRLLLHFTLLIVLCGTLVSLALPSAQAQLLPGSGASKSEDAAPDGMGSLLEEARKDGSTVIIVRPGDDPAQTDADQAASRAELFYQARTRIEEVVASVPTLWPNIQETLRLASPDGSYFWIIRAVGTAFLGLFFGQLAIRPILRWGRDHFRFMYDPDPQTTADKAKYLIFRVVLALVYIAIFFVMAMAVAFILDTGHEPSRRIIFEIVLAYLFYRTMIRAVSWNLFAYDAPNHRIVNLTDEEAVRIHRDWGVAVAVVVVFAAVARSLSFIGTEQNYAGLTVENILFIQICTACFATLVLLVLDIKDWKIWQHIFAPRAQSAWLYRFRTSFARLVPVIFLVYMLVALGVFVYRLALGLSNPGTVIAAPFVVFWAALISYGIVIIVIQALYDRRIRLFEERAAAEQERLAKEAGNVDTVAGEEMVVGPSSANFEYQPIFKPFFEMAAMAIIATIAVAELVRSWGVDLNSEGNFWASLLDIVLATVLCWLAYRAVSVFIDKRLEEEGGPPETDAEEIGGEGGGAGATRVATLLPIMRYMMIIVLFSIAVMIVLSRLGFDIGPIFAGAGVVGIAVGFGAQTLIRDIFSGAFFLLDDAFRNGEYVEIDGIKGTVERISIRSFQLRHHLGALHTIPFGEIKRLTNFSRDWVLMKLPLRVTYDTDVEKVRKLVKKLGQELMNHPQIGHTFMQPLKSQGVYKMEDSAMIIRVKFMTKPGEQFVTRKVVYESIQDLFAREGIHFAHKQVTVRLEDGKRADDLTEDEKKAVSAAARTIIDEEQAAALASKGGAGAGDR
ncbi:mechanosensitive ion channel family protein [Hoeflea poritis]|uniref:Mechanosensitive ion channel n=1 Tax=Hoeflea poritis TaxID=2993659 RepID=A0ABT4VM47_9HYPH|nr:mechanosensitive ion channel family protein [Hoeflea poritis]MDA4845741.1 mechanosensitive ion channel [Hoeflea poritis]